MKLFRRRALFKSIVFRLAVLFSSIFIVGTTIMFFATYLIMSKSVQQEDDRLLTSRLLEFWAIYETGGIDAVRTQTTTDKLLEGNRPFLLRIASGVNRQIFLFTSQKSLDQYDASVLSRTIPPVNGTLIKVPSSTDNSTLEVETFQLNDGNYLQIGISNEDKLTLLSRYRRIFILVIIPLVLIGSLGGIVFSRRSLSPIRRLIGLTRSIIETGDMTQRIPPTGSEDELDELVVTFNRMLEKIDGLVKAMRGSLDNVAHDLRTPLTRLRINTEMALQSGNTEEGYRDALSANIEESERILTVLNTLMDISEAETGVMRLDRQPFNVCTLVKDLAELYSYFAEEKGIALETECRSEITIAGDLNRLRQVVANLLDNAVKYTPSGGTIRIGAEKSSGVAVIIVEDTGPGISEEDLPRIWERLFRADRSRSQPGLGLGLGLVKAIVEAHGGRVNVSSSVGEGSRFLVTLPM